jgi:hypothetical protein
MGTDKSNRPNLTGDLAQEMIGTNIRVRVALKNDPTYGLSNEASGFKHLDAA